MRNEQRKDILEGNIEEIVTKLQPSSFVTNRFFFLIKRYRIPSLSFLPVFQININGLFSYDQNAWGAIVERALGWSVRRPCILLPTFHLTNPQFFIFKCLLYRVVDQIKWDNMHESRYFLQVWALIIISLLYTYLTKEFEKPSFWTSSHGFTKGTIYNAFPTFPPPTHNAPVVINFLRCGQLKLVPLTRWRI